MVDELVRKSLEKQGYRFVGNHSAVKVCLWCKKALNGENCYKSDFYGISSHRCVQMSPAVLNCYHRCEFCWRDISNTIAEEVKEPDDPELIINGCIEKQKEYLQGLKGKDIDTKKFKGAMEPKHFALSLAGDATLYPLLDEMIKKVHKRKITSFLVTNGLRPDVLKKVKPTQLYITLPAPNEEVYQKVCHPLIKDGWERLQESLKLLGKFERGTIRMTLVKNLNFCNEEEYAKLLENLNFKFLELKSAMAAGYARYRMQYEDMPLHSEIKEFAEKICKINRWQIVGEKKISRVVLVMKKKEKIRIKGL